MSLGSGEWVGWAWGWGWRYAVYNCTHCIRFRFPFQTVRIVPEPVVLFTAVWRRVRQARTQTASVPGVNTYMYMYACTTGCLYYVHGVLVLITKRHFYLSLTMSAELMKSKFVHRTSVRVVNISVRDAPISFKF